jgi:hypothetical protein
MEGRGEVVFHSFFAVFPLRCGMGSQWSLGSSQPNY